MTQNAINKQKHKYEDLTREKIHEKDNLILTLYERFKMETSYMMHFRINRK